MENRDINNDRAGSLLEQLKPEILKILQNAPDYGTCGIDVVLHQGEITRLIARIEVSRKLRSRTGGDG